MKSCVIRLQKMPTAYVIVRRNESAEDLLVGCFLTAQNPLAGVLEEQLLFHAVSYSC